MSTTKIQEEVSALLRIGSFGDVNPVDEYNDISWIGQQENVLPVYKENPVYKQYNDDYSKYSGNKKVKKYRRPGVAQASPTMNFTYFSTSAGYDGNYIGQWDTSPQYVYKASLQEEQAPRPAKQAPRKVTYEDLEAAHMHHFIDEPRMTKETKTIDELTACSSNELEAYSKKLKGVFGTSLKINKECSDAEEDEELCKLLDDVLVRKREPDE